MVLKDPFYFLKKFFYAFEKNVLLLLFIFSFTLGSKANASRYIEQFTDIFTKEGGKSVKITHSVPGQPTRETCTTTMVEREPKNHTNLRIHSSGKAFMQVNICFYFCVYMHRFKLGWFFV